MRRKRSSLNFSKKHKKFNFEILKELITWTVQIIGVVLIAYICVSNFGTRQTVVGQAMSEHLESGDQVLINKLGYLISDPKAGDVVVFLPNGNEKSHYYIRRVVAVPGDKVQIKGGALYVNGKPYEETIQVPAMEEAGMAETEITLGEDEYFVLGDNRNNSEDSRYANIGNVKKEYIIGKAWLCIKEKGGLEFVH